MSSKNGPLTFRCYVKIDEKKIEFDPKNHEFKELAKRCKLALAEMVTGQKCQLVGGDS